MPGDELSSSSVVLVVVELNDEDDDDDVVDDGGGPATLPPAILSNKLLIRLQGKKNGRKAIFCFKISKQHHGRRNGYGLVYKGQYTGRLGLGLMA